MRTTNHDLRQRRRPGSMSSSTSDASCNYTMFVVLVLAVIASKGFCSAFLPARQAAMESSPPSATRNSGSSYTILASTASSSVVSSDDETSPRRFMYMTEEEDRLLKEKGDLEASLMERPKPLKGMKLTGLVKPKGTGGGGFGGGGFGNSKTKAVGGKKKKEVATKQQEPKKGTAAVDPVVQALCKEIREEGLVRIDNVLSAQAADDLKDYLVDLRKRAKADVEAGIIEDSQERFADVLLNQNRCDLKIPLGPKPVHEALLDVLNDSSGNAANNNPSLVRQVIEGVFDHYNGNNKLGSMASLWELNCFMSNSGARRQLVHADCVCMEPVRGLQHTNTNKDGEDAGEPILLTCFVALQDIDPSMGPTVFMPRTHNIRSHNLFFETGRDEDSTQTDEYSPKNALLQKSPAVRGAPLPKGSCILFDPRVLHCAGANECSDPENTRALFYVTFKNPKVDSPGCPSTSGYGIVTAELTLDELVSDLLVLEKGADGTAKRVPLLASSP